MLFLLAVAKEPPVDL